MQAGDDLDQGGLAGPVVAEDTGDLPGPHPQVDVLQGDDVAVLLADVFELDQRDLVATTGFGIDGHLFDGTHTGHLLAA